MKKEWKELYDSSGKNTIQKYLVRWTDADGKPMAYGVAKWSNKYESFFLIENDKWPIRVDQYMEITE